MVKAGEKQDGDPSRFPWTIVLRSGMVPLLVWLGTENMQQRAEIRELWKAHSELPPDPFERRMERVEASVQKFHVLWAAKHGEPPK